VLLLACANVFTQPHIELKLTWRIYTRVYASHTHSPDSILLFIFDMEMDFVFLSELKDCDGCCQKPPTGPSPRIHAHIDQALNILYLFSDTHMFNIRMNELISHQQHEDYQIPSLLGGTALPEFFQRPQQRIVQITSASQVPFALLTNAESLDEEQSRAKVRQDAQNWQKFYVQTEDAQGARFGLLNVAYNAEKIVTNRKTTSPFYAVDGVSTNAQDLEYIELFHGADVLHDLKQQIQKRHYKGIDTSKQGQFDAMRLQGFAVLNDRKRIMIAEGRQYTNHSATIHLIVSHVQPTEDIMHQDNDVLHDQIFSFVDIRVSASGESTVVVKLLTVISHQQQSTPHSFYYTIVPHAIDADFPNNVLGKGVIASMLQRGNKHTIMLSNFSCLMCGANLYDEATQSCSCNTGTVPVCLPCSTDCAAGRFIVEPNADLCHKAERSVATNAIAVPTGRAAELQRFNLICMPCTGTFFCRNGQVDGMAQCPVSHPYTLKTQASGDYDCACPPGFATSTALESDYTVNGALLQYKTMVSRLPKQIFERTNETCSECPATLVCTPLYTQHDRVILCPAHTASQTHSVATGGSRPAAWMNTPPENSDDSMYNNVYQGCFCIAGYYRTDFTSENYLLDSANFIYQYVWENTVLGKQSLAGNTRVHLRLELCRLCESGWACQHSARHQCEPTSSTSVAGSTQCTCRVGFVRNSPTNCGRCPPDSMCPGGEASAIACPFRRISANLQNYCPCQPGYIVDVFTWECQVCPVNFYCPGFANMTGVEPTHTIYATRCPVFARSAAGSTSIADCLCSSGLFIAPVPKYQQKPAECEPCTPGYYCPGSDVGRVACPKYTTTNASVDASSISDCVCSNPRMLIVTIDLEPKCVCRAGWLHTRFLSQFTHSLRENPRNSRIFESFLLCTLSRRRLVHHTLLEAQKGPCTPMPSTNTRQKQHICTAAC